MFLLLPFLAGCGAPPADGPGAPPPDDPGEGTPDDTAEDGDTALPDDTAAPTDACGGLPVPGRPMDLRALLLRLEDQGCLHGEDRAALRGFVDTFFAEERVWCDAIWRVPSDDGFTFDAAPEPVRAHASVPDVAIDPAGTHHVLFNDLQPGLFAALLEDRPATFWERGLAGIGGLGLVSDAGDGFREGPLDLALPGLALVVDPDVAVLPDGAWRVATFQVSVAELDGSSWDPFRSPRPHDFYRVVGPDLTTLPAGTRVLASEAGALGGADPTVLDVPGGEVLFVGDVAAPIVGWSAPGGRYGAPDAAPDIVTDLRGLAPDAIADPAGGYRLYYKPVTAMELRVATSGDGRVWADRGLVSQELGEVSNPSIAVDPDGRWWLYYNQRDPDCSQAMSTARP
ncbi:MAG: hypothetical protein ACK4YP_07030 [Myxococcota bacterium]